MVIMIRSIIPIIMNIIGTDITADMLMDTVIGIFTENPDLGMDIIPMTK
jgi:hypothetical protein